MSIHSHVSQSEPCEYTFCGSRLDTQPGFELWFLYESVQEGARLTECYTLQISMLMFKFEISRVKKLLQADVATRRFLNISAYVISVPCNTFNAVISHSTSNVKFTLTQCE